MAGERIEMRSMARELGVNRATLYRWVGGREAITGQVISDLQRETVAAKVRGARAKGAERVARIVESTLRDINSFPPMRAFLERDAQYALRVLTSKESSPQRTAIELVRQVMEEEASAGRFDPPADLDDLAYVIVRIGESFLYSDLITGSEPDISKAGQMIRILLVATRPP
jgi:AcrR family transcriptional regulator